MSMLLFSIITICYNINHEIEKTIESVLKQRFTDYEYIIVDGQSVDGTVEIAKSYEEYFKQKGINYTIVSEKDTGIYNAMNKGTNISNGKWLLFLNGGDYLCSEDVLSKVSGYDCDNVVTVYGSVICKMNNLYSHVECSEISEITKGMVFCHQSAFILREILMQYGYDENYKLAADYNFFSQCYCMGKTFVNMNFPVSVFVLGGASSEPVLHLQEKAKIQYYRGFMDDSQYESRKKELERIGRKYKIRDFLCNIIPLFILNRLRILKYRKLGYTEIEKIQL